MRHLSYSASLLDFRALWPRGLFYPGLNTPLDIILSFYARVDRGNAEIGSPLRDKKRACPPRVKAACGGWRQKKRADFPLSF
jgi:hypothetical protein